MSLSDRTLPEIGAELFRAGMLAVPLCADSKQIFYRAMGLQPYHAFAARKRFKDIAFQSLAFHLALRPPGESSIREWLAGHDGNIGVVAGYRGLVILDFDDAAAFRKWAKKHEDYLQTPTERTPSGYHVYLRCRRPIECSSLYFDGRKAGHIKGYGGYVACSPSKIAGIGAYRWLDGLSPMEVEPADIPDLATISIQPRGLLRRAYERLSSRGTYDPDETIDSEEIMAFQGWK